MKPTTLNTSGTLADRLRVMRKTEALSFCAGSSEPKTKEAETSPASLDRHFRYKVSTEVFFLCGAKIEIIFKIIAKLFGFNHSIYGHLLSNVYLAVPIETESSRKTPTRLVSGIMGNLKNTVNK